MNHQIPASAKFKILPVQYYDQETNLHYNYFRTYDPSIGRYIESDPIVLRGGFNTYGYVFANPQNYIDRFGLEVEGTFLGINLHDVDINSLGQWPAPGFTYKLIR
jgi:RHS repeat-associated protein